ncbi:MAG: hypothetical protein U1E70_03750 [Acetobacteraceae bacterium]|nr:hypothetical protein [Pseudomonadota bacterium]
MADDHHDRETSTQINQRRRGRSWAIMIVLLALAALFYAITIVKMARL